MDKLLRSHGWIQHFFESTVMSHLGEPKCNIMGDFLLLLRQIKKGNYVLKRTSLNKCETRGQRSNQEILLDHPIWLLERMQVHPSKAGSLQKRRAHTSKDADPESRQSQSSLETPVGRNTTSCWQIGLACLDITGKLPLLSSKELSSAWCCWWCPTPCQLFIVQLEITLRSCHLTERMVENANREGS